MTSPVLFSRRSDEWATPAGLFADLDAEFHFDLDAAATPSNTQVPRYLANALDTQWHTCGTRIWCNAPYSQIRSFLRHASRAAQCGAVVVCLVPSRTDTKWWHEYVWDTVRQQPRVGVEVRFLKGRLRFSDGHGSAPFPSAVIIFRSPA